MVGAWGAILGPRGDGLQNGGHARPIFSRAACHDGRAMARALFAARHADPHQTEGQASGIATVGVMEIRVARVNHQIIWAQQGAKGCKLVIDRRPRRHHQDDRARRLDGRNKISHRLGRGDPGGKIPGAGMKVARDLHGAVPDGDGKALFSDVQRKGRAHRAKADQADLWPRLYHGHCTPFLFRITE